jgi:hypothetical protein
MSSYWCARAIPEVSEWAWGVEGGCWVVSGGSGPSLSWLLIL